MVEAVKTPALDPDALERQKILLRLDGMQSQDWKKSVEASVHPVLFRGFPYSRPAAGTEKSIRDITPEALTAWYDSYVKNRKPVVVIVGDTEGTSLASYIGRHFRGSRFLETAIPDAYAEPSEERETIEKSWDRSSSLVSIGFQAPPVRDIDRYAADVLQSYFGNMGGMYREIRENMGYSSEIYVSYEPRLRGGSFLAYAVTSPDSEEQVIEAFEREFRHFVDRPIAYLDYRSAVNTAVGSYHIRQQSPFAEIVDVSMNALAGESIEEYRSYQTKLQSVYEGDLKEVAERFFRAEKAVLLRIHGKGPVYANESTTE
jgi:zinc protease